MAVFPGAVWRGNCSNNSGPRGGPAHGVILHVNDGPNVSLWSWVNNPNSDMSTTFQILQDGTVEQYLDTGVVQWCQADGNRRFGSIECPTVPGVPMTPAQVASAGRVVAWWSKLDGFPLQLTEDPVNGSGLGWHGMGGLAWGGHFGCPGDIRKAQRAQILLAAKTGGPAADWFDQVDEATLRKIVKEEVARAAGPAVWTHMFGSGGAGGKPLDTSAHVLIHALDGVNSLRTAISDPKQGVLVRVADVQAKLGELPAKITAAVGTAGPGADVHAVALQVVRQFRDSLVVPA